MKRRTFLKSTTLAGMLPLIRPQFAWSMDTTDANQNILINVFLGGGADGLNIIAPVGEGRYFDLRPQLALTPPNSGQGSALDLDGFFAMHPAMSALHDRFLNGELAVVQATGLTSDSHSHFDSQSLMERGIAYEQNVTDGWLNRHLAGTQGTDPVFRAIGLHDSLPVSMSGEYPAIAMTSIEDFSLSGNQNLGTTLQNTLSALYNRDSLLDSEALKALSAMDELAAASPNNYPTENAAQYPNTKFGQRFAQLAQIIKADLGLSSASMQLGGWDHHDNEAQALPGLVAELSQTLDAFATDMGEQMNRITLVTMSEFGRRAYENYSAGTDHGYGSFMLALGAGVSGGEVYGDWPGLQQRDLVFSGDLNITTDYRTILAELLRKRFAQNDFESVFPNWVPQTELGLFY